MINLMHFIEAKRIKFIHKTLNSESEHWNMIGKYWLSSLDKNMLPKISSFIALTLKDCIYLFLHNSTKIQYHHGVPSEENFKLMIQFRFLSSKYAVIIKFYAEASPYGTCRSQHVSVESLSLFHHNEPLMS